VAAAREAPNECQLPSAAAACEVMLPALRPAILPAERPAMLPVPDLPAEASLWPPPLNPWKPGEVLREPLWPSHDQG